MTPEERAEKIAGYIAFKWKGSVPEIHRMIAAEIQAAVEEAHGAACENLIEQCHKHVAQAYEDAAKIAEREEGTSCPDCGDSMLAEVAEMIRARAKEILGKEMQ